MSGLAASVRPSLGRLRRRVQRLRARTTVASFHRIYYDENDRTWSNTTWLGVRVFKCPLDLWIYQELIDRIRPDLVVETGTAAGGSALFLASCLDLVGNGRVVTVDVLDRRDRPEHGRITYLTGSSVSDAIVGEISTAAAASTSVLVILDSDHSAAHVLQELRKYAPLVTPGSYLIVEDTNVNGHPILPSFGPGPYEAVETFLAESSDFVRDPECEKFFMTFNPGGYLRRR
jgi:cephalosporin hydroxylase